VTEEAPRLVVMGVSGCGKSTIGRTLAEAEGLGFVDGDSLHPQANIEKMARGAPLEDDDRLPWLDLVGDALRPGTVIACSALKRAYRDRIRERAGGSVVFLFLHGRRETLMARMDQREGHFMPGTLLDSQLATLEPPSEDEPHVSADIDQAPDEIVTRLIAGLRRLR